MKYLKILSMSLIFSSVSFTTQIENRCNLMLPDIFVNELDYGYDSETNTYKAILSPTNVVSNVVSEVYCSKSDLLYYSYGNDNPTPKSKNNKYYYAPLFYRAYSINNKNTYNKRKYYKRIQFESDNNSKDENKTTKLEKKEDKSFCTIF